MTTQSVSTQAAEFITSSKQSKSSSERQSAIGSSFSNVMDNSLKSQEKAVHTKDTKVANRTSKDLQKKQGIQESADYKPQQRRAQSVDTNTKSPDKVKDDTILTADLQSKLDKASETLENTVTSTLNLSKEELEEAMAALGYTILDLLDVDNLKQLVLHVNDSSDITAVLTDENLANQLQNLLQKIEELQLDQSFALTDEELALLMKNYQREDASVDSKSFGLENHSQNLVLNEKENTENLVQESSEGVDKSSEITVKTDSENVYNHEKEISVEVHKLNESDMDSSTRNQGNSNEKEDIEMPNQLESFMNNLTALGKDDVLNFTDSIANARQMHEITNQIVEQIKVLIKPDMTSMELQLNPEHLGKISLSVSEKDGVLTAQFTTQTQIAKEAIESQIQLLRENLNNQGLKVESIEVAITEYSFDQSNQAASEGSNQNHPQRNHKFKDDAELFTTQSDNENILSEQMELSGSQIDYTA